METTELHHIEMALASIIKEIDEKRTYDSSVTDLLAEYDGEALETARTVLFRLGLWTRFPRQHENTYLSEAVPVA